MSEPNFPLPQARSASATHSSTRSPIVELDPHRQRVRALDRHSTPVWLRSLLTLQRGATLVFGIVFGLSAIGYGYTVYTQDVWKQQHGQLKRLQVQERQQGAITESLKHQLAIAAEQPQNELIQPDPKQMLFVPSAPLRPLKPLPASSSTKTSSTSQPPSGY
jgi:hypothetical protein